MTLSLAIPDILVARAKSGDLEALEALYRAFETPVYNLALRILRSPEDAEDVLQETFLEVVRSIGQYRGEGHLWGWIRRIAATKALMRIRRDHLRAAEPLDDEPAGRPGSQVGANIDLERAFEHLSDTSRSVVREALRGDRARRRRTWGAWGGSLAAAAALAGVLLVRPNHAALHAELAQAKEQSATLEDALQRYDVDGRVLSGRAAALVADL